MFRRFLILILVLAAGNAPGQEPQERNVIHLLAGKHIGDRFGRSLAPLGDIDGDGAADFAVGATEDYLDERTTMSGYVSIYSGKTGQLIHKFQGPDQVSEFGNYLKPVGDYDGDQKTDLAIDTSGHSYWIVSPSSGEKLFEVSLPNYPLQSFFELVGPGDLDGDSKIDFVFGDCAHPFDGQDFLSFGQVVAVSGNDGKFLWQSIGDHEDAHFGCGIFTVNDLDNDGLRDLITLDYTDNEKFGRIHLISSASGKTIQIIRDKILPPPNRLTVVLGDLNGDLFDEIGIAFTFPEEAWWATGRGQVDIIDGRKFETLYHYEGIDTGDISTGFGGDELGSTMSAAGDVDGDGFGDFLLGTDRSIGDLPGPGSYSRVYLRSGKTGKLLSAYEGRHGFDYPFANTFSPLGDIDGDGRAEFLIGSPGSPKEGKTKDFGEVRVLRYDPGLSAFIRGDANGDGRVTIADAIAILIHVFLGASLGDCPLAADLNGFGLRIRSDDAFYLLNYLFRSGGAPVPPFPDCGSYGGPEIPNFPCERSTCGP